MVSRVRGGSQVSILSSSLPKGLLFVTKSPPPPQLSPWQGCVCWENGRALSVLIEMLVAFCSSTCLQPLLQSQGEGWSGRGTSHSVREGQEGLLWFWAVIWDVQMLCF